MKQIVFFILLMTLTLVSCRTSKEAVVQQFSQQHEQIVRDSVIIERHRVDSFIRRDSVFISQQTKNDTVYIERNHYHYLSIREHETQKDSTAKSAKEEKEEKKDTEAVVEKNTNLGYSIIGFVILSAGMLSLMFRKK